MKEEENTDLNQITFHKPKKKRSRFKRFIRYSYFTVLHLLAAGALFAIFTALAVHFKWTNDNGSVDLNSRYTFSHAIDCDNTKSPQLNVYIYIYIYLIQQLLGVPLEQN